MKTFKIVLTALAFTAGIGGAFIAKAIGGSTAYFYLIGGAPADKVVGGLPNCVGQIGDCAQLYNLDANGNPTTPAGSIIHGVRQ